ncbi:hypothetical protein SEA_PHRAPPUCCINO_79 [Mycobacterium phage Phrappuccino]|uniref:Minor tail protein n=1 Tax=Mycobacterium phage Phrappuccino TaxID=2591223 RepID=A0A514DDR9_9CAUD|nr:hypothetical protein KHQ87_gp079 [Mycobacterium phage Phrappuccino]QDH91754.1 hypothetical protein SEA_PHRAPPUCCINO_79 [Mycobacterium phage Phrappuccino]QIQ63196.1 hypothetical protein SEA_SETTECANDELA_79 [Mycobacterium phage Settecandela]
MVTSPQFPAPGGDNPQRGIASIQFGGRVLRFRTNPNSIWWNYKLITAVENTYGGRVVQILGARIEDLVVQVDIGRGGWPYMMQVVNFMRDMINDQRKGDPGTFTYTTRNWRLKVFALSVPFQDTLTATTREIELRFKVQEDVSGVQTSAALSDALARLQDGVGFKKSKYNTSNSSSWGQ